MVTLFAVAAFAAAPTPTPVAVAPVASTHLFAETTLVGGTGKVKTGDCGAAYQAAIADVAAWQQKKGYTDLLAVFAPSDARELTPATQVDCEIAGDPSAPKGATVHLKALVARPGDPSFPQVDGARDFDIVKSLVTPGMLVGMQLDGIVLENHNNKAFLLRHSDLNKTLGGNRNNRAVSAFRDAVTPALANDTPRLAADPEITGLHYQVLYNVVAGGKPAGEALDFYVPTEVAKGFVSGDLSEQQLVDKSQVLLGGVKIDISFVDAKN